MKKATYREIPALLEQRKPFKGSSVTALAGKMPNNGSRYIVYSYGTILYEEENGRCVYFNSEYYSRTTSRLQNILRQVFNIK